MYRRPLAGVFDFGFCARAKRSKVKGAGRRPAVQKAQAKRTLARVRKASANVLWRYVGTGVIFTCRLLADASATERRASKRKAACYDLSFVTQPVRLHANPNARNAGLHQGFGKFIPD